MAIEVSRLESLRADAKLHRQRIAKADWSKLGDAGKAMKSELADNLWPWVEAYCEAVAEEVVGRVDDLDEAVFELIEREDSAIHPELAMMIIGVFEHGKLVAAELEKLLPHADDLQRKRLKDMVHAYRQGAEIVAQRVAEVTLDDDGDGDTDGETDEKAGPPAGPAPETAEGEAEAPADAEEAEGEEG